MRSAELARLAGVTVRTLRHYHQVGVLAEPERGSNGYRRYGVHDLVRLLRIKRLAAVGIPLDRMAGPLDGADDESATLLDELDGELAGQIDRLVRQRELIAQLRSHAAAPDLPPELAPFFAASTSADLSPAMARADRDQSVLIAHLAGEEAIAHLVSLYARLAEPDVASDVTAIAQEFSRLGPDSTDEEVVALSERFARIIGPVVAEVAGGAPLLDLSHSAGLVDEYTAGAYNARQLEALQLAADRMSAAEEGYQGGRE